MFRSGCLRLVSLPSKQEGSSSTLSIAEDAQPNLDPSQINQSCQVGSVCFVSPHLRLLSCVPRQPVHACCV